MLTILWDNDGVLVPCLIVQSDWGRGADFRGAAQVLESIREVPDVVLNQNPADWRPSANRRHGPNVTA